MVRMALAALAVAVVAGAAAAGWQPTAGGADFAVPQDRLTVVDTHSDQLRKLQKLDRLQAPPQVLVLGSSRAMKVDPETITTLTGARAFNLGVSGGSPADVLVLVRYVAARFGAERLPHLVWGLDIEAMRNRPVDPTNWNHAQLRRALPLRERMMERLPALAALADGPAQQVREPHDAQDAEDAQVAAARKPLRDDGFLLYDYQVDAKPPVTERAFRDGELFAGRVYGDDGRYYPTVHPDQMRLVEETIAFANSHGVTPTIYITPINPLAVPALDARGYSARRAEVLAFLGELAQRRQFNLLDSSDVASFGGNATEFYDSVHPAEETNDRILAALHERGWLAPPPGRG